MDSRVSTEFRRHGIFVRIFAEISQNLFWSQLWLNSVYSTKIHGIPWNFADLWASLYNIYELNEF